MKATTKQKQLIHINAPDRDYKAEMVQWITGDTSKISCNDLNFDQANKILEQLGVKPQGYVQEDTPLFWAYFDRKNKQQMQIQSLLHQCNWTMANTKYGRVPDLVRFGNWLQSSKSPVGKPLKKMTSQELSKVIIALEGIVKSTHK